MKITFNRKNHIFGIARHYFYLLPSFNIRWGKNNFSIGGNFLFWWYSLDFHFKNSQA